MELLTAEAGRQPITPSNEGSDGSSASGDCRTLERDGFLGYFCFGTSIGGQDNPYAGEGAREFCGPTLHGRWYEKTRGVQS